LGRPYVTVRSSHAHAMASRLKKSAKLQLPIISKKV